MIKALKSTAFAVLTILTTSFAFNASADSLDFTEITQDSNLVSPVELSNATIASSSGTLYFFSSGYSTNGLGSICGNLSGRCEADIDINFKSTIENLSFEISGYDPGDSVTAMGYLNGNLVNSLTLSNETSLDISSWGLLDRLFLAYEGTIPGQLGYGYVYSDFEFTSISVVPLPAALPLFGAALLGLGFISRRKRQQ
ncbi:MAG: VPLPA-CTERM sorting domain-containing protein [Sneathiellales bacterium]|nr:VPLPA-CTERM sorting domain-containing protein [Sneathiellales bacterium]